jgi:hypothetical protein
MNYLEWVECMRKDVRNVDNQLARVIEKSKNTNQKKLEKFHKKSCYGKFVKRRD